MKIFHKRPVEKYVESVENYILQGFAVFSPVEKFDKFFNTDFL